MNLALDFSFYNWDLISNFVLKGLYFSVMLTVVATIGGILFGTVLALMRLSGKKWLVVPATIYVNGMRSIPLVMVILWFFLLVPAIIGRPIGAEVSAVVTFIAFEAAYFSEIMRAGIQSIPRGQVFAGQALGMTYGQNMKLVILPQAFRNMLPVLLTLPATLPTLVLPPIEKSLSCRLATVPESVPNKPTLLVSSRLIVSLFKLWPKPSRMPLKLLI